MKGHWGKCIIIGMCACALLTVVLSALRVMKAVGGQFAFSIPLAEGKQEISAILPTGNYSLTVSTNQNDRAHSVIPAQRDYLSQMTIEIRTASRLLLQGTNINSIGFGLSKGDSKEVFMIIHLENSEKPERVLLHFKRGF